MSADNNYYIFIDPFSSFNSGVSTYTNLAVNVLNRNKIKTNIIKRNKHECIDAFKIRIRDYFESISIGVLMVEAPETLACSEFIPEKFPLHIRLHCSRSLGAALQGKKYNDDDVIREQKEINRAKIVSSPSWVSYFASETIFSFSNRVIFFPNPCPELESPKTNPKFDVLFLGRYQRFKGIDYLNELSRRLPDVSFLVATDLDKNINFCKRENVFFCDGSHVNKSDIYCAAKVVLIPSVFESSSMVLLEAFAYQKKVVVWEHVGALEYNGIKGSENVYQAKSFNIDDLEYKLVRALEYSKLKVENDTSQIEKDFFNGINAVLNNDESFRFNISPVNEYMAEFCVGLNRNRDNAMRSKNKSPFIRKARKLFKNPRLFFRDSALFTKASREDDKGDSIDSALSGVEVGEFNAIEIEHLNGDYVSIPEVSKPSLNCVIGRIGKIEFPTPKVKVKGHTCAFFSQIDDSEVNAILSNLNEYTDFKYLSKDSMYMGCFDIDKDETSLSLINRIDFKNKNNFSLLDYVILVNAPLALCHVLRSIGTSQRIILVITDGRVISSEYELYADVVITSSELDGMFSRVICCGQIDSISLNIRRVLQEGFPKNPDMLFCLSPEVNAFTKNDFATFDYDNFDGLIKVKRCDVSDFNCMNDFYDSFAQRIVGLAIKESIFNRYKNICEIDDENKRNYFIVKRALNDGAIFDVKEL